jgi:predicted nucleotidyltransferase
MDAMYSPDDRKALADALAAAALEDTRLSGVAVCGSMAVGREDAWSDIDLVFAVADSSRLGEALDDWTSAMVEGHGAVHHVDIASGRRVYRAFLLPSTLEVDLNFVPSEEFRAEGPKFRLLRGSPSQMLLAPAPVSAEHFIGMGWLHAAQARSCIARGRLWQAERMIAGVRDQALALACLRHNLPTLYGAAVDSLPPDVLATFTGSIVHAINLEEACRAYRAAVGQLRAEARQAGRAADDRLLSALTALANASTVS